MAELDLTVQLADGTLTTYVALWIIHSDMVSGWYDVNRRSHVEGLLLNLADFTVACATTFDKVLSALSTVRGY
jgi:hypothetical protein